MRSFSRVRAAFLLSAVAACSSGSSNVPGGQGGSGAAPAAGSDAGDAAASSTEGGDHDAGADAGADALVADTSVYLTATIDGTPVSFVPPPMHREGDFADHDFSIANSGVANSTDPKTWVYLWLHLHEPTVGAHDCSQSGFEVGTTKNDGASGSQFTANSTVGTCTITITSFENGYVTGTFSANAVRYDGTQTITVSSGKFRTQTPTN